MKNNLTQLKSYYQINASTLQGNITLPASKSHTMRALLFATMAKGISHIYGYLPSPDTDAMINACRQLGAAILVKEQVLQVTGVAGKPTLPTTLIDAGNSGQVLRFIAGLAALLTEPIIITGDHSICHNRPVTPLLEALPKLGVKCRSMKNNNHAPIEIIGPLQAGHTTLDGSDSQPVSALLMAAAFVDGEIQIEVRNPGEKPWIDLTLAWLDRFNIHYSNDNYTHYTVYGKVAIEGFDYIVPGDLSSLAFPLVAALITQSFIAIDNVDMDDVQGDKAIVDALQMMGAKIILDRSQRRLIVDGNSPLQGVTLNINDYIDAITILAVVGCFAGGTTTITGAAIARQKESDRIHVISQELRKMGADIEELADGLIIKQSVLHGAEVQSHHDHRVAMSLATAALAATGTTHVTGVDCVKKSFPNFAQALQELQAKIILG